MPRRSCLLFSLTTLCITPGAASAQEPAPGAAPQAAEARRREERRTPVVRVFDACKDAVVNIAAVQTVEVQDDRARRLAELFDLPAPRQGRTVRSTSVGTGVIVHPSGYIVTNAHVVAKAAELKVVLADRTELDARAAGADPEHDLALLKVDAGRPLAEIAVGRSDDLMVGETVVAIGNPLGLNHTVTAGVVSALERTLKVSEETSFTGLVQTDASINPGNSGGPLLNIHGELVGVNFAIRNDGQNIGFAIPVDRLSRLLPALLDAEGAHGIRTGLEVRGTGPAEVLAVADGSPAARAGLRAGDRLRSVDGRPLERGFDYHIGLLQRRPGEAVALTFDRGGGRYQATLTVEEKPRPDGVALAMRRLGVTAQALEEEQARRLGARRLQGMVVLEVEENGPAADAGLEVGDILVQADRTALANNDALGRVLDKVRPGQVMRLTALRLRRGGAIYRLTTAVRARGDELPPPDAARPPPPPAPAPAVPPGP